MPVSQPTSVLTAVDAPAAVLTASGSALPAAAPTAVLTARSYP